MAQPQKTVVFIGDSITEVNNPPYGEGFVAKVARALPQITPINKGIGGQAIQDLWARWTTDVIDNDPDIVVMLVGINDTRIPTDIGVFQSTYLSILNSIVPLGKLFLALDCFYVPGTGDPSYDQSEMALCNIYRGLRNAVNGGNGIVNIDLQVPINAAYAAGVDMGSNGIHPNDAGHVVIANSVTYAMKWAGWV